MHTTDSDAVVIGAGVLGVALSYWLSAYYDCSVLLVDMEAGVARHSSKRNTGVMHRPFYLDPRRKRVFARAASRSVPLWRSLARERDLPWRETGTLEVARRDSDLDTLRKYRSWGLDNGMEEQEMQLLDGRGAAALEPEVRCRGALLVRSDASVDFSLMTQALFEASTANGTSFLPASRVASARSTSDGVQVTLSGPHGASTVRTRLAINAAGGGSLALAHAMGSALDLSSLSFRGEYWRVDEPLASRIERNVYTIPRYPQYPFLDPHFVVRADGTREVGPNAVLVSGPYSYQGFGATSAMDLLSRPPYPKAKVLSDRTFLGMVAREWRSSLFKGVLCDRVRAFVPSLADRMLTSRGVAGIRSSVLDRDGFLPEARTLYEEACVHVLNYNSPGATGAPAFSGMLVAGLADRGYLARSRLRPSPRVRHGWTLETAS